jgi:arsenate reductase
MSTEAMSDRKYNILFLCTGNSARSILAEAILGREGKGHFNAFSAGSQPMGEVNPFALELLNSLNYGTNRFRSKSWDEFSRSDAPQMDFIFTVCGNAAGEVCPVWLGHPLSAHWGVRDPASATGSEAEIRHAFEETYRILSDRIVKFINLPLDCLDKRSIQCKLDQIGRGS